MLPDGKRLDLNIPMVAIHPGGGVVFGSFNSLHYLATRGNDVYLVEEKIR
jgi:hypothetical protein